MTTRTSIRVLRTALRLSELTAATGSGEKVCMLQEYLWSRQKLHYAGSQCRGGPPARPAGAARALATSCSLDLTPAFGFAGRAGGPPRTKNEGTQRLGLCFAAIQAAIALAH